MGSCAPCPQVVPKIDGSRVFELQSSDVLLWAAGAIDIKGLLIRIETLVWE